MSLYDLAIIGGGINGTAIARDAAGRGLSVVLFEQGDLSCGTSWTSSKLIHGGLRYLEQGAFGLVQEGLSERAILLHTAPHIIWPARFVLPHHKGLRPAWQLRLGLFIYDALGAARTLPPSRGVDLKKDETGRPLKENYTRAFAYSDCCVDDVRLVVLNALDAASRGANICTRTKFLSAKRAGGRWHISVLARGHTQNVEAKAIINAAGPWLEGVNAALPHTRPPAHLKLVKGSHIVVPALFTHKKAYIFQNGDGRIVFAIPYQEKFTLLGTTDIPFEGNPAAAAASKEEIAYLCTLASDYFKKPVMPNDVVMDFAGVRALYDNRSLKAKDLSRDYVLEVEDESGQTPLLSIYGGKLTAGRQLAEKALLKLKPYLSFSEPWTARAAFPGGDFAWQDFDTLVKAQHERAPFLSLSHITRLLRAYGTRIDTVLGGAKTLADLGLCFGADLYEGEVKYLMQHEWAVEAEDILLRRSKMVLHLSKSEQENLAAYMKKKAGL